MLFVSYAFCVPYLREKLVKIFDFKAYKDFNKYPMLFVSYAFCVPYLLGPFLIKKKAYSMRSLAAHRISLIFDFKAYKDFNNLLVSYKRRYTKRLFVFYVFKIFDFNQKDKGHKKHTKQKIITLFQIFDLLREQYAQQGIQAAHRRTLFFGLGFFKGHKKHKSALSLILISFYPLLRIGYNKPMLS